jgi:hypothetical protein
MSVKLPTQSPEAASAAKPAETNFNPMRPEMPHIPGVDKTPRKRKSNSAGAGFLPNMNEDRRRLLMGGALGGAVLLLMLVLWWAISKPKGGSHSSSDEDSTEQGAPANSQPDASAPVQVGPTVAATVEELSKPWAAKKFVFSKPLSREKIDAMVIRLPGGGLWAFSLQDPFGRCQLEYVTDAAAIASSYGYRASHPMVVNPCDKTVYDPLKVGSLGGDTYARGGIVQGNGLRPPLAIDVKLDGQSIVADGIE